MAVAIQTGIPAREWLTDTRALMTAVKLITDAAEKRNRKG